MSNYTVYHLHSDYSLLDSCTKFEEYVDRAVELGQTAIASTEHGNIFNWVLKKMYCDKKGIKYIHGVEVYLTHKLFHNRKSFVENKENYYVEEVKQKVRDNYHTILLAKNYDGIKELNSLVSISYYPDNFYFKPRITFEDFLNVSDNIITTSACLASPIWSIKNSIDKYNQEIKDLENELSEVEFKINNLKLKNSVLVDKDIQLTLEKYEAKKSVYIFNINEIQKDINELQDYLDKIIKKYKYLEVQPHVNLESQKEFNKMLVEYHYKYNIPLVAGTDTHSINKYKAECRTILQTAKHIEFLEEDTCDLTYKTYEELYEMFVKQGVLTEDLIKEALENTNVIADSIEDFTLDVSFKYPILHSKEEDEQEFVNRCWERLDNKISSGVIDINKKPEYIDRVNEELKVFKKVGMLGFMLSMSDFIGEARNEGIPFGFARGSAAGSLCAYLTDINDVDPIIFDTNFARFCNEDRVESGDIDVDVPDEYRQKIFDKIINKIGRDKTARVFALGTNQSLGAIDDIGRALDINYKNKYGKSTKALQLEKKYILQTETDKNIRQQKVKEIQEKIKEYEDYNKSFVSPYSLDAISKVKEDFKNNPDKCKKEHKDICYYLDGLVGVNISQSIHPAGIVASPITLADNYGTMINDGEVVLQLNMDAAHECGLI